MSKKEVKWIGASLEDLKKFPEEVKNDIGSALRIIQYGTTPENVSHLKDGVYEIKESHEGEAYRAVYIAKFEDFVYVLHCFHKKSKSGKAIPKKDNDLIWGRFKDLKQFLEEEKKKEQEQCQKKNS
jgi:phage-related protein